MKISNTTIFLENSLILPRRQHPTELCTFNNTDSFGLSATIDEESPELHNA